MTRRERNRRTLGGGGRQRRRDSARPTVGAVALAIWLVFALRAHVSAHEGPPYPLFVDKKVGPHLVSAWADPDVGTGTFFIAVESARGGAPADDLAVEVCVRPASGRRGEDCYAARRDASRDRAQFKAEVPFDKQEVYRARVAVRSSLGSGEADVDVEATPPGLGRWDLLLYLSPFAAVGLLWLRATLKGRSLRSPALAAGTTGDAAVGKSRTTARGL